MWWTGLIIYFMSWKRQEKVIENCKICVPIFCRHPFITIIVQCSQILYFKHWKHLRIKVEIICSCEGEETVKVKLVSQTMSAQIYLKLSTAFNELIWLFHVLGCIVFIVVERICWEITSCHLILGHTAVIEIVLSLLIVHFGCNIWFQNLIVSTWKL